MTETLQPNPDQVQELGNAEWQNVSNERIDDVNKAEHMASVENAWRDKAKDLGKMAIETRQITLDRGDSVENADHISDQYLAAKDKVMTEYGPQAVEDMGKAYDAVHGDAFLPPENRQQVN